MQEKLDFFPLDFVHEKTESEKSKYKSLKKKELQEFVEHQDNLISSLLYQLDHKNNEIKLLEEQLLGLKKTIEKFNSAETNYLDRIRKLTEDKSVLKAALAVIGKM